MQQKDLDRYQRNLSCNRFKFAQDSTVITNSRGVSEAGAEACSISLFVLICLYSKLTACSSIFRVSTEAVTFCPFPRRSIGSSINILGFWCPPNQRVLYAYTTLEYTR